MKSKIKKIEDAFKYLGLNPKDLPDVSKLPLKHSVAVVAGYKLFILTEALNKEDNKGKAWEPNWNDSSEYKWYPWFEIDADEKRPSGFGFSVTGYGVWSANTDVGSRLCFKSKEVCLYAIKQFEALYKEYILLLK